MTDEQIRQAVLQALQDIAPEAEPDSLDPALNLRDQLDIDSMDFLNFVIAVHETLQVDIPETDYPRLSSLDGCLAYLKGKLAA